MQLARPENLWLLLLLLPMLVTYVGYWVWKQRKMNSLGDHPLIEAMATSRSARRQIARAVLVFCAVALLAVAAARPQWGQINRPIKRMGVDVVFALDLSRSMLARDATPDRLQAAKDEIDTTMQLLSGDRVGLVVFTAVSFAQSPLTTDYGAIRFYLDKLDPEQMPMGGTSVGRAMLDAVGLLEAQSEKANAAENQVIVLITDGEDHESDPLGAAKTAREKGIHVVTVGIGSESGERIPIVNADGSIAGFKRDRQGNIIRTQLDSKTLRDIADVTGGRYIHYNGRNSVANGVVGFVNELEKTELETLMRERYEDRFIWFVAPALLLLLIAAGLGERRRSARKAAALTIVLSLAFMACDRPFERPHDDVARANELVEAGEFAKALDLYDAVQGELPTTPELAYNRGRALLGLERYEEAQEAFARGLESEDPTLQFDASANLGLALAGQEEWAEAYEAFRAALRIAGKHPDIIPADRIEQTRRDLEVAFRKLYPPCSKLEDDREDDDAADSAKQLEEGKADDLTLCGLDDDWFLVPAIPGTTVSVRATFSDLRDEPDPEQAFARQPTDIRLALVSGDGETVLAVDQGEQSTFDPSRRRASRAIEKFLVEPDMIADGPGVYVKIEAAEGLEFSYDVAIESIPPCRALQEDTEPNDTPGEAAPLGQEEGLNAPITGHICSGDTDWYSFEVQMGDALFFDVVPAEDRERGEVPELDIALYDGESGKLISQGIAEAGLYTVGSRLFERVTTVKLRIRGAAEDTQGPYTIVPHYFPPCVVGDDRYEDNDDASTPHELDPSLPMHRYLRICENDPDFFYLAFPEDESQDDTTAQDQTDDAGTPQPTGKVQIGLANISTVRRDGPTDTGKFTLDLMSPSGDQILVEGTEPGPRPPSTVEESPMPLARVLFENEVEGEGAVIRVTGDPDFYHLVQLNPQQPPSQQDQQEQQEQQEQDEQQDQGDEGQNDQQEPQDGESGQDDSTDQQDEGGEDDSEGGNEENDAPEEEDTGDQEGPSDEGDDESERDEPAPGESGEPGEDTREERQQAAEAGPDAQRMEAILDALEKSDDNFQMKKALEKVPGRFIEKDW